MRGGVACVLGYINGDLCGMVPESPPYSEPGVFFLGLIGYYAGWEYASGGL